MQRATITAYHGHTSTVFAVAWSPNGKLIVSGGNDSTVLVWDAMTGRHLLTNISADPNAFAVSSPFSHTGTGADNDLATPSINTI